MKKLIIFLSLLSFGFVNSQTLDELKALQQEKKDSIAAIQTRVDALQSQIDAFPGWRIGAFGTIGGSLSQFNNWYAQGVPNNEAGNIGFTVNGFANKIEDKYFWKNALTLNLNWIKFDDKDNPADDDGFRAATDVFNLSSLYGYRLSKSWAVSAFGEYRTTIIDNFNDPGYLDLGVGATWTPNSNLTVVIHPLNYNFVFSSGDTVFNSSLGAKIVADYTKTFGKLNLKSNFSTFQSYEDSNLSNWTWTNSLGYNFWKNIGLGFDFALRDNRQEAANFQGVSLEDAENDLQTFWTFGLSYKF